MENSIIIQTIKEILKGAFERGIFVSFLVIAGWSYAFILALSFIYYLIRFCIRKLNKSLKE